AWVPALSVSTVRLACRWTAGDVRLTAPELVPRSVLRLPVSCTAVAAVTAMPPSRVRTTGSFEVPELVTVSVCSGWVPPTVPVKGTEARPAGAGGGRGWGRASREGGARRGERRE